MRKWRGTMSVSFSLQEIFTVNYKNAEFLIDATYLLTQLPRWLSGKESACQLGDADSIPGSRSSPGEGDAIHSSILAWKIPWTEEPGGLESMELQELDTTWWLNIYIHSQGVPEKVLKMYYVIEIQWSIMTSPFTEVPTLSEKIYIHPSFPIISHYYFTFYQSLHFHLWAKALPFPNHVSFPTKILSSGLQELVCLMLLYPSPTVPWLFVLMGYLGSKVHSNVCVCVCLVAQSCPTLCNPMDCSLPGSSVHGDSPGKNTGVCCMPSSRESSQPRDQTQVSHIAGRFFTIWATREAEGCWNISIKSMVSWLEQCLVFLSW